MERYKVNIFLLAVGHAKALKSSGAKCELLNDLVSTEKNLTEGRETVTRKGFRSCSQETKFKSTLLVFKSRDQPAREIAANIQSEQDRCISMPSLHLSVKEIEFLGFASAWVDDKSRSVPELENISCDHFFVLSLFVVRFMFLYGFICS